ncbi:MAG: adenylate/guanylate cyclase domain-containing protein, partial [Chloroflexota bacterium]
MDQLSSLISYVPPAVAQSIYTHPNHPQQPNQTTFRAAVLFADVSGFTPLAEALSQKGPRGAEELTRLLNQYFSRMISLIEQ